MTVRPYLTGLVSEKYCQQFHLEKTNDEEVTHRLQTIDGRKRAVLVVIYLTRILPPESQIEEQPILLRTTSSVSVNCSALGYGR
jgi:hypothetical protein